MNPAVVAEFEVDGDENLDVIEELRLRALARKYYFPAEERDTAWHPFVLDEMSRKDSELSQQN